MKLNRKRDGFPDGLWGPAEYGPTNGNDDHLMPDDIRLYNIVRSLSLLTCALLVLVVGSLQAL